MGKKSQPVPMTEEIKRRDTSKKKKKKKKKKSKRRLDGGGDLKRAVAQRTRGDEQGRVRSLGYRRVASRGKKKKKKWWAVGQWGGAEFGRSEAFQKKTGLDRTMSKELKGGRGYDRVTSGKKAFTWPGGRTQVEEDEGGCPRHEAGQRSSLRPGEKEATTNEEEKKAERVVKGGVRRGASWGEKSRGEGGKKKNLPLEKKLVSEKRGGRWGAKK